MRVLSVTFRAQYNFEEFAVVAHNEDDVVIYVDNVKVSIGIVKVVNLVFEATFYS